MKINIRLLLITFVVIVLISISSTFIYHSVTTKLLKNQYSQALLNSSTDFKFAFQQKVFLLEEEFLKWEKDKRKTLKNSNLDFIFSLDDSYKFVQGSFIKSDKIINTVVVNNLHSFIEQYPNIILKYYKEEDGKGYFFGKIIDEEFLNSISEKVRAEVVLIVENTPFVLSHANITNRYFPNIISALHNFDSTKTTETYYQEEENADFFGKIYKPEFIFPTGKQLKFLLFTTHRDLTEFRNTMQLIAITIALAGVLLALIFILLFSTKLRKQISLLSEASKITASGDLQHRVEIITKDELGNLGEVFNNMLDKIEQNEIAQRHYTELITIINETPSLKELCDSVLGKIISTSNLSFGVFYVVENRNAKPVSTFGINSSILEQHDYANFYDNVIENQQSVELEFDKNPPQIKMGLVDITVRYLLVTPLVFNKKVIGVIELAAEHIPEVNPSIYLMRVREQISVGLNNALSYEQLENLVNELKFLNEDYQKQNLQITEQNSELIKLHDNLKKQTVELEEQRKRAVELTHVKSQFLASMSHELRTPLNSIIGLTELISDDISTHPKTKERLKIVLRNSKKLLSLINNILEFSKIESGKFELEKSNFVLSEFFLNIYNTMNPLVAEKELEFIIRFDSDYDLLISTDKHKLEQILLNLLSNAIKFTEIGKIEIEIKIVENISLQIKVIDTGVGVSDEDKSLIFDEFEQSNFTKTKKYQGAGLGLAICKRYISLLGGQIKVSSNKFNGSTFTLYLKNVVLEKFILDSNSIFSKFSRNISKDENVVIYTDKKDRIAEVIGLWEENKYSVSVISESEEFKNLDSEKFESVLVFCDEKCDNILKRVYQAKLYLDIPVNLILIKDENYALIDFEDVIHNSISTDSLAALIKTYSVIYKNIASVLSLSDKNNKIGKQLKSINENITVLTSFDDSNNIDFDMVITEPNGFFSNYHKIKQSKDIPFLIILDEDVNYDFFNINIENYTLNRRWENLEYIFELIVRKFQKLNKAKRSISVPIENTEALENNSSIEEVELFEVLVVDDDKDTLFTVGEILHNLGCKVLFANNGAECIDVLKENNPDLVLLDIMMPVMDGFETIKRIRNNSKTKTLTVYALTAQAMLDDLGIIKNNGFDDLITKPVIASTLSFKIEQVIQSKK